MNNGNPFGPTPAPLPSSGYGYGGGGPPADDTLAWIGVACSGLSWLTCCCFPIPIINVVGGLGGFALAIAGTICGYMAWQKAKQANTRTDIAMAGLVIGALSIGLRVLGIIAVVAMIVLGVGIAGFEQYTQTH